MLTRWFGMDVNPEKKEASLPPSAVGRPLKSATLKSGTMRHVTCFHQ